MLKNIWQPFAVFFTGLGHLVIRVLYTMVLIAAMVFGAYHADAIKEIGDKYLIPALESTGIYSYEPSSYEGTAQPKGGAALYF